MHNYLVLETEANHQHFEHGRRVKAASNERLADQPDETWWPPARQALVQGRAPAKAWLPTVSAPLLQLLPGAERARP